MPSLRAETMTAVPSPSGASPWVRRELDVLERRLHEQHPELPLAEISALVEHEHAVLASSRVEGFRMILTERAVRRRLASRPGRSTPN